MSHIARSFLLLTLLLASGGPLAAPTALGQEEKSTTTILLMGGDAGPQRIGLRTDSMTVATLDRSTGRSALFGVPRNLMNTPLPEPYASLFVCGCWESLLNELYFFAEANPDLFGGGPNPGGEVMMATMEHLLGIEVDYFALVDLPGFASVIDALGGVTLDIPQPMSIYLSPAFEEDGWQQYVIPAGRQHLDGRTALAYSRSRENVTDYDRMARQRCVLGGLLRQADVGNLLRNYPTVTNNVSDAVMTNIPLDALPDLIALLDRVDFSNLYTIGFTTPDYMQYYVDEWHPVPDPAKISQAVELVITQPAEDVAGTFGTLPASCAWVD
jgi:polyisoprenyl-teichoic acid--peptidoglycan teichoic acid transferase